MTRRGFSWNSWANLFLDTENLAPPLRDIDLCICTPTASGTIFTRCSSLIFFFFFVSNSTWLAADDAYTPLVCAARVVPLHSARRFRMFPRHRVVSHASRSKPISKRGKVVEYLGGSVVSEGVRHALMSLRVLFPSHPYRFIPPKHWAKEIIHIFYIRSDTDNK